MLFLIPIIKTKSPLLKEALCFYNENKSTNLNKKQCALQAPSQTTKIVFTYNENILIQEILNRDYGYLPHAREAHKMKAFLVKENIGSLQLRLSASRYRSKWSGEKGCVQSNIVSLVMRV